MRVKLELWYRFSLFLLVSGGSGPARKLGETVRIHPAKFRSKSAVRSPRNDEKRICLRIVNFDFATLLLGIGRFGPQIGILCENSVLEPDSEL